MDRQYDFKDRFDHENGFYLTANLQRFSKLVTHLDLFRRIGGLPGDIVECGVFKGASLSRFVKFRDLLENPFSRRVIGFDVFGAFPPAEYGPDIDVRARFVAAAGETGVSLEELTRYLEQSGVGQNVDLVAGDVRETIPAFLQQRPALRIALLHIDVDLYEPTLCCLEALYPHVVRGGLVVLDDYGAFPGANKAIEEFFADQPIRFEKLPFSHAVTYVVKP